jgi:protein SCO1/2
MKPATRPATTIDRCARVVALLAVALMAFAMSGSVVLAKPAWERATVRYRVPDIALTRDDGTSVRFRKELDDGQPVILNFIFTSCAAICPVMSQTFARIQRRLGDEREAVHLVSVSIDPEQDTPARLREYAKKLDAGPRWSFYTGTHEATVLLQRAFDAYRGDKMNHVPVTFLRVAPDQPWVRLEGFASADDVVQEYRKLRAGAGDRSASGK